jgi:hypothetical protein
MKKLAATTFLIAGLVAPVAGFAWLSGRLQSNVFLAAAIAIAAGWVSNLAWAHASQRAAPVEPSAPPGNTVSIATRFGWACPAVLVLLTWLALRFLA